MSQKEEYQENSQGVAFLIDEDSESIKADMLEAQNYTEDEEPEGYGWTLFFENWCWDEYRLDEEIDKLADEEAELMEEIEEILAGQERDLDAIAEDIEKWKSYISEFQSYRCN